MLNKTDFDYKYIAFLSPGRLQVFYKASNPQNLLEYLLFSTLIYFHIKARMLFYKSDMICHLFILHK